MNISSYIFIRAHTLHGVYVQELEERVEGRPMMNVNEAK